MTRRIIFIIGGALLLALLILLLWLWFFTGETPLPQGAGDFGSAGSAQNTGTGTQGPPTNVPAPVGGTSGRGGLSSSGNGSGVSGGIVGVPQVGTIDTIPGVEWLGGTSALGGGATTNFVPSPINQLNNGVVGGTVSVLGNFSGGAGGQGKSGSGLESALIGAGIGTALCTAGLVPGALAGLGVGAAVDVASVPVSPRYANAALTSSELRENFLNCMTRVVARAALDQMTSSIVNWINSGFEGKPSFVTNYKQFFTNVADQAAGEYIKGSALSFLCSPFRNQIRVAIAQSYAKRNAQSCTLSGVVKNLNAFTKGDFSQGGWGGLLSFIGTPTNNPFGAFAYAQAGLAGAQSQALQLGAARISPEGYLAYEEKYDCKPRSTGDFNTQTGEEILEQDCKTRITTPGSTIAGVVSNTLKIPQDSLNLAKNFDEIVSALIKQLTTKALQGGLSNLSGTQTPYQSYYLTPDQQQAQAGGQALLQSLQSIARFAEQYGSVWQGAIRDIQTTQEQLNTLANCWSVAASSSDNSSKQAQALANKETALATLASYSAQVDAYNAKITKANAAAAKLLDLQTRTLNVTSSANVSAINSELNSGVAGGSILTEADVSLAQQDRTTLQSALNAQNTQSAAGLQQCNAF